MATKTASLNGPVTNALQSRKAQLDRIQSGRSYTEFAAENQLDTCHGAEAYLSVSDPLKLLARVGDTLSWCTPLWTQDDFDGGAILGLPKSLFKLCEKIFVGNH